MKFWAHSKPCEHLDSFITNLAIHMSMSVSHYNRSHISLIDCHMMFTAIGNYGRKGYEQDS